MSDSEEEELAALRRERNARLGIAQKTTVVRFYMGLGVILSYIRLYEFGIVGFREEGEW